MKKTDIFEVDTHGMRDRALERGLGQLLLELYSNAVDENVSRAAIDVCPTDVRGRYEIRVEDDSPDGFRDLGEAYTLYAPSYKRDNPEQRGRFNVGEKFVIAACEECDIYSTTGHVRFDDAGRHRFKTKRVSGTLFRGIIRTNREEVADALALLERVIVPAGITVTVNGLPIPQRAPVATVTATLPTVLPDENGVLSRRTQRQTTVSLYEPLNGYPAMLYELGVPVVETGDAFDIDVAQKVPLNQDRDNVTPKYLATVRAIALNAAVESGELEADHVAETWVREAAGQKEVTPEAVQRYMDLRFGIKRVSYDPSDPEANSRAVEEGYRLVYSRDLTRDERANVNAAGLLLPAGQVTPSNKWEYSDDPDATPERVIPEAAWRPGMRRIADHARWIARELLGIDLRVRMVNEPIRRNHAGAAYGKEMGLIFNVGRLGYAWFETAVGDPRVSDVLIHEFAHHYSSDHLDKAYHDALSGLGARMVRLALTSPERFA